MMNPVTIKPIHALSARVWMFFFVFFLFLSASVSAQEPDGVTSATAQAAANDDGQPAAVADTVPPAPTWSELLMARLSPLQREADESAFFAGISVWDLTGDSLVYAYNQQKLMRPASTQKVLTAVTALSTLGARYQLTTRAGFTGTIETRTDTVDSVPQTHRVLHGDICVIGGFDPAFSYSDLKDIVSAIERMGIERIDGNIVGDVSMKDTLQLGNGWCWDDVPSSGIPYLTPLMFDQGAHLGSRSDKCMPRPDLYFVRTLAAELRRRNIAVGADAVRITTRSTQSSLTQVIYTQQRSLEQILQRMMKNSNNLYAEAVFYQLAAASKRTGVTWKDCARIVENTIQRAGGSMSQLDVVDGSGVSLYDYVTPATMTAMLRYAYRQSGVYDVLYHSLPIAGVDGTLGKRMGSGPAHRNVHAKTGTVAGVSTLAGYVRASNGNLLAFSIMLNGVSKSATGRAYQDRVCQALAE